VARKGWSRRARLLTLLATMAGMASCIVAIALDATPRAAFAAASIVCLATAAFCATTAWLEASVSPPIDLESPTAEPPVPQSQVALIYDAGEPPNNSLESDACKPRAPQAER
jgi:hypothetical protein